MPIVTSLSTPNLLASSWLRASSSIPAGRLGSGVVFPHKKRVGVIEAWLKKRALAARDHRYRERCRTRDNQGRRTPSHLGGRSPRHRHACWVGMRRIIPVVTAGPRISPTPKSVFQADESLLSSGKSFFQSSMGYSDRIVKSPSTHLDCRRNCRMCYDSKPTSDFLYILIIRGCRLAPSSSVSPPSSHPSRPTPRSALAFEVYSRSPMRTRRISRVPLLSCSCRGGSFAVALRACQSASEGRGRRR